MSNLELTDPLDCTIFAPPDQWHASDSFIISFNSSDTAPAPSPEVKQDMLPSAALRALPILSSHTSAHNMDPEHTTHPQNPLTSAIKHGYHDVTSILAQGWNHLSETEKRVSHDKETVEKQQRAEFRPNSRFGPTGRDNGYIRFTVCGDSLGDIGVLIRQG